MPQRKMRIEPHAFGTAILLFCAALFRCRYRRDTPSFNLSVLLLGVTSIAHHSRMHRWWINDRVRAADNCAVALAAIVGLRTLPNARVYALVLLYGLAVLTLNACEVVARPAITHATAHLALVAFLLLTRCGES